jgi:phosphoserine phosphatase
MTIVLFDLDRTIIDGRIIDHLALKYSFYYELNRLRTNLKNGLIKHEMFTKSVIRLLKGLSMKNILKVANEIPLMPNTNKMFNSLRNEGYILGIISDGLSIITNNFSDRFGLNYSIAHQAEIVNNRLTGEVRLVRRNSNYLLWKKEILKEFRDRYRTRIYAVGNGDLDAPMLRASDLGIAFNATAKAKRSANFVVNTKDMKEIARIIHSWDKKWK